MDAGSCRQIDMAARKRVAARGRSREKGSPTANPFAETPVKFTSEPGAEAQ
jgi:hypothetical protein